MFDLLIEEMNAHLPRQGQAAGLVDEFVAVLNRSNRGNGLGGVPQRRVGDVGAEIASWLEHAPRASMPADVAETVLGEQTVDAMAKRLMLAPATVAAAAGYALLRILALVNAEADGFPEPALMSPVVSPVAVVAPIVAVIPAAAPVATAVPVVPAASEPAPASRQTPAQKSAQKSAQKPEQKSGRWVVPVVLAFGVAGLIWRWTETPPVQTAIVAPAPLPQPAPAPLPLPEPVVAAAPTATRPPRLSLSNNNGVATYGGQVGSEATRITVVTALTQTFAPNRAYGEITVDPAVADPVWLANFGAAVGRFRVGGLHALFDGTTVGIGGPVAGSERDRVIAALTTLFGTSVTVGPLPPGTPDFAADAGRVALGRLTSLGTTYSAQDVAGILNATIITFPSRSSIVPGNDQEILNQAAAKLRTLPAGTKIEVAGYTDNTGSDAGNVTLSRRRAEAVRTLLTHAGVSAKMLTAKGYGAGHPVESNDTEDGRLQNRRIEYHATGYHVPGG